MKQFSTTALALICGVLVIALFVMKHGDDAQHQNDAKVIAGYSNQLDSAQTDLAVSGGKILALSNSLDQSQSASLAFSTQLFHAQSAAALGAEQITNLNQQVVEAKLENQTLGQRVLDLTNQIAGLARQVTDLTRKMAVAETNLNQANNDYALLENRLRRDVAERVVVERKFNNPSELKAQLDKLKNWSPDQVISADSIYAGLDIEVTSNSFHVISPN